MKVLQLAILLGLATICLASSHSEAPGSAANPNGDLTDVYMFRSYEPGREDFVTILINIRPLQDPFGGPNYFSLSDEVFYEINIDQNHDCVEDLTFQMYYGNSLGGDPCDPSSTDCIGGHKGIEIPVGDQSVAVPLKFIGQVSGDGGSVQNLNWFEWYQINKVTPNRNGNQIPVTKTGSTDGVFGKPFDNAGTKSFPDYESYSRQFIYEIDIPGCNAPTPHGKTFLGQRRESFFVKLGPIFDLINFIPIPGFPGAVEENNDRNNDLQWKNIDTWAFEVHKDCLLGPNSQNIIAAWASVRTLNHAGGAHTPGEQINRLAQPLVNEVVIGLRDKNKFNSAVPSNDGQFATYVTNPTFPALVNILFKDAVNAVLGTHIPNLAPPTPRSDLVTAFLTGVPGLNKPDSPNNLCEQMRLNVAIDITPQSKQKRYGVLAGDNAGMPNGRRPGDDALDITVQVAMGALCELGIGCQPTDAPVGSVQFTDGAPTSANQFQNQFPYLNTPCAGSDGKSCGFNFNPDCPECPTCGFCPVFPEYPPAVTCPTETSSSSPSSPAPSGPTPSSPSGPTVVSGASSISVSVVLLLSVLALFL